ncbi:MAG: hypothetical protein ACQEXQ_19195 [Bacillota bacterium]
MNKLKCIGFCFFVCVSILSGCGQSIKENTDTATQASKINRVTSDVDTGGTVSAASTQMVDAASRNASNNRVSASDVRWVYMSWPIPSDVVSRPLIGGRDEDRIVELLHWLEEAEQVDGSGLSSPLMGRSMAVNIELSDGRSLQIRPAWKCDSHRDEQGNMHTSCKGIDNRVWVAGPDDSEYFVESEQLYGFVSKGYMDWMPNVKPYEVPDQLKTGAPFSIRGHGSRTDQATIVLMKGKDTIWEQRAIVNEGEWQAEGIIPDNLPEADYEWKIDTGTSTYGATVHISK